MKPSDKRNHATRQIVAKRLADDLGVSVSTISRAFNRDAVIAAGTRSRILEYAASIGYRPNPYAQSLITRKNNIVGVIVSDIVNPFYPEVLTGLCEALRQAGLDVMLFTVPGDRAPDEILPKALVYRPEFVIVLAATISFQAATEAAKIGTKLIFFNRYVPGMATFSVTCDNFRGGREVADHLIRTGHRRMAYLAGPPDATTTIDRWEGFRQRCAESGIEDVGRLTANTFSYEAGFQTARQLYAQRPSPDAIFCANDTLAMGVLDALRGDLGDDRPDRKDRRRSRLRGRADKARRPPRGQGLDS